MTEFFFDAPRQLLIYPRNELITRSIPEARELNGQFVAVPRNLLNSQILRHFNFPVVPIITDENYDWPRSPDIKQPYESQKLTANFMVLHRRAFCLSDMGTGKTLAMLWSADWLMRQHPPGTFRVLIVCPLSIIQRVWTDAIFKNFLGARTFQILHGSAQKRLDALAKPADYYVVNFDGVGVGAHTRKKFELDGFSKALAERTDIKLAIIDEASAYKDASTKRHRIAREVIGKRDYCWMSTGTPTPQAPTDAYGLGKLMNNAHGQSFRSFQLATMVKVSNFLWKPQREGYEKARRLLTPAIRFAISQVWDGPEMTTQQREVELTPEQKKHMADLKRDLQIVVKSGHPISADNEAVARTKFVQISLGAIYDRAHKAHAIDAASRLAEIKAVLDEAPGKTLVFVPLTSVIDCLYKELKNLHTCEIVNGSTSQKDRSRIFQAFQDDPDPRVLIAHAGVMAHGLNLWMARTVCWYGPVDSAEVYQQSNKRAHRPGQKFPVTVVQIVSNPLEREIFRRLENNLSLQGALLDLVSKGQL